MKLDKSILIPYVNLKENHLVKQGKRLKKQNSSICIK